MIKPQLNFFKFVGKGDSFAVNNSSVYHVFEKYIDSEKMQAQSILFIDCGEKNITKTMNIIRDGWSKTKEVHFLITHLHGDHVGGLSNILFQLLYKYPDIKTVVHLHQDLKDDFDSYLKITGVEEALTNVPSLTNIFIQYHSDENFQLAMSAAYEPIDVRFIRTTHTSKMKSYGILLTATRIYDTANKTLIDSYCSNEKTIYNQWRVYYSGDSKTIPDEIYAKLTSGQIDEYYQDLSFEEIDKSHPHAKFFPHMTEIDILNDLLSDVDNCKRFKFFPYHYSNSISDDYNKNRVTGSPILSLEKFKAEKALEYAYVNKETNDKMDKLLEIINTKKNEGKIKKTKANKSLIYDFAYDYLQYGYVAYDILDFVFVITNPFSEIHNLNVDNIRQPFSSNHPFNQNMILNTKIHKVTDYFRQNLDDLALGYETEKMIDGEFYEALDRWQPLNILIYHKKYKNIISMDDFEFVGYYNKLDRVSFIKNMNTDNIPYNLVKNIFEVSDCFFEYILDNGNELMDISERCSEPVCVPRNSLNMNKYLLPINNISNNISLRQNALRYIEPVDGNYESIEYIISCDHLARLLRGFTTNINDTENFIEKYITEDSYKIKVSDEKRDGLQNIFMTNLLLEMKIPSNLPNVNLETIAVNVDGAHTYIIHISTVKEELPVYIQDSGVKNNARNN